MATRIYLPSSGTPPLPALAVNTNWELTNSLVRRPCSISKTNTALSTSSLVWPAAVTQQWAWYQFQSDVLKYAYDWLTTDTVSMVLGKCAETTTNGDTHLAYVVRVVSGDGTVIRGVIGLYHATSTEFPLLASAATRIHSARVNGATAFSSQAGDRIIIELGLHGVTPGLETIYMRVGDPTAINDFALTAALTTDLCPWVQLSRTVEFGTAPEEHSGAVTISGVGAGSSAASKGAKASLLVTGLGVLFALGMTARAGSTTVSGVGEIAVYGEKAGGIEEHSGSVGISGIGGITAYGSRASPGSVVVSGVGTLAPLGTKGGQSGSSVAGVGTLAPLGEKGGQGSVVIAGEGALIATGEKGGRGSPDVAGEGSLVSEGEKGARGNTAIAGVGTLVIEGTKSEADERSGAVEISGVGLIFVEGLTGRAGSAELSGIVKLEAIGQTGVALEPPWASWDVEFEPPWSDDELVFESPWPPGGPPLEDGWPPGSPPLEGAWPPGTPPLEPPW